jgi:hypothetical protein
MMRTRSVRPIAGALLAKYTRLSSAPLLAETYDYYKDQWIKDGDPSREGLQKNIDVAAAEVPEAKNAKPEQFLDLTFLDKIRSSGLVEQLWGKP